ncbi:hypothetical protein [Thiolapillus sp.]
MGWRDNNRIIRGVLTKTNDNKAMLLKKKLLLYTIGATLSLVGCTSPQYIKYAPDERIELGIVQKKIAPTPESIRQNEKAVQKASAANAMSMYGALGYSLHLAGMPLATDITEYQSLPFIYIVNTPQRSYQILDHYPGFEVGNCVKVFVGSDLIKYPPRIARGFGCKTTESSPSTGIHIPKN